MGKKKAQEKALAKQSSPEGKAERKRRRNLAKTAEAEGLEIVAKRQKGTEIRRLVPEGIDPATGRRLKDAQGREPAKQGGRPATSTDKKQIRARARRRGYMTNEEIAIVYKPLEEWDAEELARGRPRGKDGSFGKGPDPSWITPQMYEEMAKRFKSCVKTEMNKLTVPAIEMLERVMNSEEVDSRGRPMVPASVKVDIAKFLLEHTVGKPKQEVTGDISVRLQGVLAAVMVNPTPGEGAGYGTEVPGLPGYVKSSPSRDVLEADLVDEEDMVDAG